MEFGRVNPLEIPSIDFTLQGRYNHSKDISIVKANRGV